MKAAVLGLGISGVAAADFLKERGYAILGVDAKKPSHPFPVISDSESPENHDFDLLVKSPGISLNHPWVKKSKERGVSITSEIDLALQELYQSEKKILAITGSNGKTTTTLMSVHLINSFGGHAIAGGNVGTSLLSLIKVPCDTIVVELSSFQLQTIGIRPYFAAAALLNVTPNHLDYHANFAEYVQAKLQLLSCIKEKGTLFVGRHVPAQCRPFFHEQVVGRSWYDLTTVQEKVAEIFPLGYRDNSLCLFPHDVENAAAALMLARIALANSSLSPESLKEALMTFVRPPHRLERIAIKGGVTYINDSKATSVDAVIKAVEAIPPPIVLIVGGVDKGGVYREWIPHFKEKVVKVFALGEAAQRIKSELEPEMCVVNVPSLYDGVKMASEEALRHSGSTVLLSPGCSSYDQFKDYQHRGETFREFILSDAASRSVQGQSESRRVSDHEESRNVQRAR